MKIIVSSKNPVKINASETGFKKMFSIEDVVCESVSVPSGVSDQPMSEEETLLGAMNRVKNAKNVVSEADYWVGIEGGLKEENGEMETFAWVYIENKFGKMGKGRTGSFLLPEKLIALIKEGKELGDADDIVFGTVNSKQNKGTVGVLTKGVVDRTDYYIHAVILALIPFINPELYS